jgi:hypothetical protein
MRIGSGRTESGKSGGGFGATKETVEAAQTFVDALDGGRVGEAQVSRSAKGIARYKGYPRFLEEKPG